MVEKGGSFNAFVGSFEVKHCEGVFLNTLPIGPETHWKQSLIFVYNHVLVSKDELLSIPIQKITDI
jgi:hypothetical protein